MRRVLDSRHGIDWPPTACIVTRGDVDLDPVLNSLPPTWPVDIYDNSSEDADLAVLGRYISINRVRSDVVYVQDDDCVLAPEAFVQLVREYEPGVLVANMPERFRPHYSDSCLIGFGALFDRWLPERAFDKVPGGAETVNFNRTADVYFTTLTERRKFLDLPFKHLPWATDESRMYRQKDHVGERFAALAHARSLR